MGYYGPFLTGYDTGFFEKTAILSHSLRRNLRAPFSPNSMLLRRFAWKGLQNNSHFGSDAGMHWAATLIKGARGEQV